jgi:hypothetical protein
VCKDDVNTIAGKIMAYLQKRPMASDSLDGIAHWWLLQQSIMDNKVLVQQALEQLAEQGKVAKNINPNRETVYSLREEFNSGKYNE